METRICVGCKEVFVPSSRHKNCPKCRHEKYGKNVLCACGNKMQRNSSKCLECHNKGLSGEMNGNWKGGTTRHVKGYIMRGTKDHPRGSSNHGYVFEHTLVMEEYLGRYLLPEENVHHMNGIKDDNRIENLELWCKPQPSGIRAEDAYKHALSIVELYSPLFSE